MATARWPSPRSRPRPHLPWPTQKAPRSGNTLVDPTSPQDSGSGTPSGSRTKAESCASSNEASGWKRSLGSLWAPWGLFRSPPTPIRDTPWGLPEPRPLPPAGRSVHGRRFRGRCQQEAWPLRRLCGHLQGHPLCCTPKGPGEPPAAPRLARWERAGAGEATRLGGPWGGCHPHTCPTGRPQEP